MRLICFPHGGGAASTYAPLARELIRFGIQVKSVQYPRREDRFGETCPSSLIELARNAAAEIRNIQEPFALYGHSMGATVAFEVARILEVKGAPILHLFLSGRNGPSVSPSAQISHLANPQFIEIIQKRYGGLPKEVLGDPDILSIVLETLRGDLKLLESYICRVQPRLQTRASVFGGRDDPNTDHAGLAAWTIHFNNPPTVQLFDGGHFFNQSGRLGLCAAIVDALRVVTK